MKKILSIIFLFKSIGSEEQIKKIETVLIEISVNDLKFYSTNFDKFSNNAKHEINQRRKEKVSNKKKFM